MKQTKTNEKYNFLKMNGQHKKMIQTKMSSIYGKKRYFESWNKYFQIQIFSCNCRLLNHKINKNDSLFHEKNKNKTQQQII